MPASPPLRLPPPQRLRLQATQLLQSGKHVYSAVHIIAVPDAQEILDWCDRLVATCQHTGRQYMLGETTLYRPQTTFCRRQAASGAFGSYVFAEGEYIRPCDWPSYDLRQVQAARAASQAGKEWDTQRRGYAAHGIRATPMVYPTHSVSGPMLHDLTLRKCCDTLRLPSVKEFSARRGSAPEEYPDGQAVTDARWGRLGRPVVRGPGACLGLGSALGGSPLGGHGCSGLALARPGYA